ncbi:uncharacterized protein [Antedon mediterranea]|uniref:uncharacterized protein n=1 Tax=Antedon mediterranea TaxID=105859 RepID=UPI003AF5E6FB
MESVVDTVVGSFDSSHLVPRSMSPASLMDIDLDKESYSEEFYTEPVRSSSLLNGEEDTLSDDDIKIERERANSCGSQTDVSSLSIEDLYVPIVGYEVMEQRARFTVFKIHVRKSPTENWFVFRRYTDFVRLNTKLKRFFPTFRLALPPKRWFGDNYDANFLEDRQLGLQAFINNVTSHKDILQCKFTREFFCLDDQPGAHDSLEESRALCDSLEDTIYNLRQDLVQKEKEVIKLKQELRKSKTREEELSTQLLNGGVHASASRSSSQTSEESLVEGDYHSCVEADQSSLGQSSVQDHSSLVENSQGHCSLTENEPDECEHYPNGQSSHEPTSDPETTHDANEKNEKTVASISTDPSGPKTPSIESDGSWDKVIEFNNKECQTKPNEIPVYSSNNSSMHKQFKNASESIEHEKKCEKLC